MKTCTVRAEMPGDEAAISALTETAFNASRHGYHGEACIVQGLREAGDLSLSLVAVNMDLAIVGHCAFSPVEISDGSPGWFVLGPVSVIPLRQHSGIGSGLVAEGIERLRAMGACGCAVLGDPEFYGRLGFSHDPALALPGIQSEHFMRLVLQGPAPKGLVELPAAFSLAS